MSRDGDRMTDVQALRNQLAEELKRRADPAGCTEEPINGARIDCRTWHVGRPYSRWCRSCLLREAAAALAPPAEPSGWQPIASYAKREDNYDPVLVADADGYVVEANYSIEHDVWWELNSEDDGAPGNDRRVTPTHWMPLPALPTEERP